MNCMECKDLLGAYTEDLLGLSQKKNIADHLEQCPECREEAEALKKIQIRLIDDNRAAGQAPLKDAVMIRILREQNARLKNVNTVSFASRIRNLIMKNSLVRIAAAALVIVAIIIGLYSPEQNLTFAKVVEPVLNARTLVYDIVALGGPKETVVSHDLVIDRKIRRASPPFDMEMILDIDNSQVLGLDTVHKTAAVVTAERAFIDGARDFLRLARSGIEEALSGPQSAVEELGWKNIDGRDVAGFKLSPGLDGEAVVIWADPGTALPVQIDIRLGDSHIGNLTAPLNYTLKNIEFDVPVDPSLVEIPAGYRLMDPGPFVVLFAEDKFLKVLRIWTEHELHGYFPETLDTEEFLELMIPTFKGLKKLKEMNPEEREKLSGEEIASLMTPEPQIWKELDLEESEEFSASIGFGVIFLSYLEQSGADWRYSGGGVQLGERGREIFRHRMPDSPSWRVVYGDLHVGEVPVVNPSR